jgi:flagellar assembly protein FliH
MSPSPARGPAHTPIRAAARSTDAVSGAPRPETQPFPYVLVTTRTPSSVAIESFAEAVADPSSKDAAGAAAREIEARVLGRQEGRAEAEKTFADRLAREREGLAAALAQFTRDRADYFQKIEGEVVQLALAIARKILHREAQTDPLLLVSIVRVALEKIDGATGVVLRVHPDNAAEWRRYLLTHLEPANHPQIVEDPAQPLDHCVLETAMGTAVIGVEVQLKEIEHGLMDLLAARPGASS